MATNHGFQTVTDVDHRAWLWVSSCRSVHDFSALAPDKDAQVVSLLSLTYSILCMGARLTCKWEHLSYDDIVLGLGYLVAFAHYGTIFHAISIGVGALATIESQSKLATAAEVCKVQ